jgi:hypothetical protein
MMELLNSPLVFLLPLAILIFGSMYIKKRAKKDDKANKP